MALDLKFQLIENSKKKMKYQSKFIFPFRSLSISVKDSILM